MQGKTEGRMDSLFAPVSHNFLVYFYVKYTSAL
jgi:hypothetical protein